MRPSDSPEMDAAALAEQDRAEFAHSALENLFDVSPNAIFVTDSQGVIRGANPRAAELFGYSQAEFYGMPIENLVPCALPRTPSRPPRELQCASQGPPDGRGLEPVRAAQGWNGVSGGHHAASRCKHQAAWWC